MDLDNNPAAWKKIVNVGCSDYSALTRPERVWFNVESLIGAVTNGGIVSFYYNSGANHVYETIDDLKLLGHDDIALMLEKVNKLFPDCDIPNEFDKRNEIIENWDDNDNKIDKMLDDLDQEFYGKYKFLEDSLRNYMINHYDGHT